MKLAIVGNGKIVTECLFALQDVPEVEVVSIWGRPTSLDRTKSLADDYGIMEVYTDYEKMLTETNADTVYIGIINSMHYDYAKLALIAGKNVIMEKPFTATAEQAKDLASIALDHHLFIFEAMTVFHNETYAKAVETLPWLGRIRMVQCNFSQYSSRYQKYKEGYPAPSFTLEAYGGALMDINVYNINFVVGLFGQPEDVLYVANKGFNGIDVSGILILVYKDFVAELVACKDSDSESFIMVQGEEGYFKVPDKANTLCGLDICIGHGENLAKEEFRAKPTHHRMVQEFRDFVKAIEEDDYDKVNKSLAHSISVCDILERAAESAGLRYGE